MLKRGLLKVAVTISILTLTIGTISAGAATLSPWASKNANLFSNEVETTFTPSWKTKADDKIYGCAEGKYIKNSWCKVVEGNRTDYTLSKSYYRPSTTWVHTSAKLTDNPFYTAVMTYGWGSPIAFVILIYRR